MHFHRIYSFISSSKQGDEPLIILLANELSAMTVTVIVVQLVVIVLVVLVLAQSSSGVAWVGSASNFSVSRQKSLDKQKRSSLARMVLPHSNDKYGNSDIATSL